MCVLRKSQILLSLVSCQLLQLANTCILLLLKADDIVKYVRSLVRPLSTELLSVDDVESFRDHPEHCVIGMNQNIYIGLSVVS